MAQGIQLPVVQTGLSQSINQAVKQVGTINIPATIDPSAFKSLAQPLGRVSGLATEFEKSIAASNARVLAFGASVGIINGVQGAFADLLKTGIEVQKTLADIAAISGQGGRELSKFGDALFDVAKTTGQSFKTASQAALEFSRQGLGTQETLKRTTDALTLTRFTTLNAAEAVDVLTAAANSFSTTGITTAQIINKLVAVDTKFAVSAEDLANGLSRAGSIAQEVGVSFDELNAAITVAQERTARGGAVIGNALKTIFTRLRSDETVQALRDIGVESLNAQGGLKGAIPLLQEVANKVQNLSGGERVQILEAVASKYNINILSALLDDLNNANSKFGQAVSVSAGASNQAYERQIQLNKTLAAELNRASVSATQLFNKLSEIGVTDSLATLLKYVNNIVDSFNKLLDSESVGGNIARGLVKGISDVFFTVGLPIIAAIFVKLTADIAKFGVESLKTILQINQQSRERIALEQAVVNTLIRDQEIMATILALSGNRAKQEEYLLGVYNRQLAALQQVQNIASAVTPALMTGGLTAMSGQIKKKAAGGYLPGQEAADVRRGIGGASPSSKVVSIPNFAFGGGKRGTMIANTSEYIVPNFANGGSAIFNQNMVKAYGLPAGAKKISAAGGYIPNFATSYNLGYVWNGQGAPTIGGKIVDTPNRTQSGQTLLVGNQLRMFKKDGKDLSREQIEALGWRLAKDEELKYFNAEKAGRKTASSIGKAAMLIPSGIEELNAFAEPQQPENKDYSTVSFPIYNLKQTKLREVKGQAATIPGYIDTVEKSTEDIGKGLTRQLLGGVVIDDNIYKKAWKASYGAQSAINSLAGGLFEAGVRYLTYPEGVMAKDNSNTLDFPNLSSPSGKVVKDVFGVRSEYAADLKGSDSGPIRRKFASQVLKNGLAASGGYIPNFAAGSPLGDAINREMAAGLKPSQIRVTQDGRLKNSQNPNGFAVINTRDEPNGKIPNFADRRAPAGAVNDQGQSIGGRFTSTNYSGYASPIGPMPSPSGASNDAFLTTNKLMTAFIGLQMATSTLQSTFKQTDSGLGKLATSMAQIGSSAAGYGTIGGMAGEALKGRTGMLGKMAGYMGPAGVALGAGIGLYQIIDEAMNAPKVQREKEADKRMSQLSLTALDKQDELKIFEQDRARIESRMAELRPGVEARSKAQAKRLAQSGPYGVGAALPMTDQERKDEEEIKLLELELTKNAEKRKQIEVEIATNKERQKRQAERDAKDLIERVALTTKINSLNEAAAAGENAAQEKRAKRQSDFIRNSVFMTESQRLDAENNEKLLQIEEKRDDLKKSILLSTTKELAQGKLTTVEANAVELLRKRLEAGEDIKNVEQELLKLGIQGNSEAGIKIKNALSDLKIADSRLATESKITKERQNAVKEAEKELKLERLRIGAIEQEYQFRKDLEESIISGSRSLDEAKLRTPLALLENTVATQPFATKDQQYELVRLRAEIQNISAQRQIDNTLADAQRKIFDELKNSVKTSVKDLSELGEIFINNSVATIDLSQNTDGLIKILQQLENQKNALVEQGDLEDMLGLVGATDNAVKLSQVEKAINNIKNALAGANIKEQDAILLAEELNKQMQKRVTFEVEMAKLRKENPAKAGLFAALNEIENEAVNFEEVFAKNTTLAFRDGLRDAMSAAISQTDDLNGALQNVAMNFLKSMQNAFMQNAANNAMMGLSSVFPSIFPKIQTRAKGGLITGGSGYRDDVPAMLTGGEFVMRKSAVQKYGAANLAKMNNGGIFLPGIRGGGSISGYDALRAFANQTTTSGATDILKGGGSSAFINLEDQSSKLSRYALLNDDLINQEIRSAQEQGLNIITEREAYRTQQRKAFQKQLVGTIASAALSYGIGALTNGIGAATMAGKGSATGLSLNDQALGKTQFLTNAKSFAMPSNIGGFNYAFKPNAYGGMIRRYASGGPTDDIPALLMSGEYVMNRQSTSKYGKRMLDAMNQGRASRFADGGEVGASTSTTATENTAKMTGDVNISINVTGQTSETQTQGNTNQGGIDYKKMSEKIKAVVLETINEEKRLGGALRTR